ncbi:glycoside hydrolase family 43 protein [Jonesia quinghaiensis]|uniref:glycoside hydrolase family 43 protein n=1 Tax=Jonesia quinghaiensis TaxID=262806 RepID=UPI0003FEFB09|nr:glycoside hydrolase family 43 protein [Jonesia quinghaiensis]
MTTAFHNPILPGYYPDPSIIRVGGDFYLVNSTFEHFPGLPIHHSRDLVNWSLLTHAISRPEQLNYSGVHSSGGLYAPTLREHDGTFYLVCTLVGGDGPSGNFLLTAPHPSGPWSDPMWVADADGIDPSLFFDTDGTAWWMGCKDNAPQEYEGHAQTWLRRIDVTTGELYGPEFNLWSGALRGARWAEGPHIVHRNGWYYLLTAEGGTEFNHAVTAARSRTMTGPYVGYASNPILTHRHLGHTAPVQYVGHSDIVELADGSWWMVALATRPINGHHILGRETFLTPLVWEDDWPVVNPGVGTLPTSGETPLPAGDAVERSGHIAGGDVLAHLHDVLTRGIDRSYVVGLRGGLDFVSHPGHTHSANPIDSAQTSEHSAPVTLTATEHSVTEPGHPACAAVRMASHTDVHSVTLHPHGEGTCGLVAINKDSFSVRAQVTQADAHTRLAVIERRDGVDQVVAETVWPYTPTLTLSARFAGQVAHWEVTAGDQRFTTEVGTAVLSSEVSGSFVGTVVGPFVEPGATPVDVTSWHVHYEAGHQQ